MDLQEDPNLPSCPEGMVFVPGGKFRMGRGQDHFEEIHDVVLDAFCLDLTEVTVSDFAECVRARRCDVPGRTTERDCNYGAAGRKTHPMNCVTWRQAAKYCSWIGKRLPTEAEWEFAALGGPEGRSYPWGEESPEDHLCWRGNGFYPKTTSTCTVGSFPAEAFGLYDMGGNVAEWVEDWFGPYSADSSINPIGAMSGERKVARGGQYWMNLAEHVVPNRRYDLDPQRRSPWLGFRCGLSL